jgi:hypothetical protein
MLNAALQRLCSLGKRKLLQLGSIRSSWTLMASRVASLQLEERMLDDWSLTVSSVEQGPARVSVPLPLHGAATDLARQNFVSMQRSVVDYATTVTTPPPHSLSSRSVSATHTHDHLIKLRRLQLEGLSQSRWFQPVRSFSSAARFDYTQTLSPQVIIDHASR